MTVLVDRHKGICGVCDIPDVLRDEADLSDIHRNLLEPVQYMCT